MSYYNTLCLVVSRMLTSSDKSGDNPEVIGEASILMAQTCFPGDGLDGGTGHSTLDVACESLGNTHLSILSDRLLYSNP